MTLPLPLPLTAQAMSMLREAALAWAASAALISFATITPRSSTTLQAHNSGWPATMDRAIRVTMPLPLPLTAQATCMLRERAAAQGGVGGYATIKYNASGTQQWVARYDGPGNALNAAYAMAIDISGNVYVTGQTNLPAAPTDYASVKYDPLGTQQWVDRYNGPGNGNDLPNGPYAIAVDASGNPYVTGESAGSNGDRDYATIRYWGCWPACTTRAEKDSFASTRRRGISDRRRAVQPESRTGRIAKKDRKSTDSVKNSRKRLVNN